MQELKQLIIKKLKFKKSYFYKKNYKKNNDLKYLNQLIHILLEQKKKQQKNQPLELKISQTLMAEKIQTPYKLMQFYITSKQIMMLYNQQLQIEFDKQHKTDRIISNIQNKQINQIEIDKSDGQTKQYKLQKHLYSNVLNKKDLIVKIINLYIQFFKNNKNQSKSQQVVQIYKKKLCQQGFIPPTIFCWLRDWIYRSQIKFLKEEIQETNNYKQAYFVNKSPQINDKNSLKIKSFQVENLKQKTIEEKKISQKQISKQINFNKQDQKIKIANSQQKIQQIVQQGVQKKRKIQKLALKKKLGMDSLVIGLKTIDIQISKNNLKNQLFKSQKIMQQINRANQNSKILTIGSYQISNLLPNRIHSKNDKDLQNDKFIDQNNLFLINKQIVIGAFYEKFITYYKKFELVIPGLDIQFIKRIKKNDKAKQIKKKIKNFSKLLTRFQPLIKNSIQQYEQKYFLKKDKIKTQQQLNKNDSKSQRFHKKQQNKNIIQRNNINVYQSLSLNQKKRSPQNYKLFQHSHQLTKQYDAFHLKIYKKQQNLKQPIQIQRTIKFQLNLPQIPETFRKNRKKHSKMMILQSGIYKQLDYSSPQKQFKKKMDSSFDKNYNLSQDNQIYWTINGSNQIQNNLNNIRNPSVSKIQSSIIENLSKRTNSKKILQNRKNPKIKLIDKILHNSLHLDDDFKFVSPNTHNSILIQNKSKKNINRYVSDFKFHQEQHFKHKQIKNQNQLQQNNPKDNAILLGW